VSDYNEQEQWERAKSLIGELWIYVVGGVAIGGAGLWAWNWNKDRIETRSIEASSRYEEAIDAFTRNDRTRGMQLVEELNGKYQATPYAALASLIAARSQVETNELDKAAASLKSVMDTATDPELRTIARLRLARVQSAQGKYDDALATLEMEEPGEFAPRLADTRGDVLLAKGDREGALREYLAARTGDDKGQVDRYLLDLKIRDLGGTPPKTPEEMATES
jgi:predicted negative regulator of RcsB-dependent stress response